MCIEALKEELSWAIDKRIRVVSNKMLFKRLRIFSRSPVEIFKDI